ncbi:MAG: DUF429 domain-containing protein [Cryobacterium sp.]|nr:DUF429 domain-containing protein [Oligoflexia bacterium]
MSETRAAPLKSKRYLGLELAGAKNQKTSLSVLEYYPKEQKIFLLDVFDKIAAVGDQTGDQALLETIEEALSTRSEGAARMGVNVPTELPPCITECKKKACQHSIKSPVPAIRWMYELAREASEDDEMEMNIREITPYTQRPFEIWARYRILPMLTKEFRFEIDEALGGNRAPLTARMHYLQRHLSHLPITEVWPKLTIASLAQAFRLPKRLIENYRKPEEGYAARVELLETLILQKGIFIYDRDLKKLGQSLTAFDSFLCAYTALLADRGITVKPPKGYPKGASWVAYYPLSGAKR